MNNTCKVYEDWCNCSEFTAVKVALYVKYANKEGVHRDRNILEQIGIF